MEQAAYEAFAEEYHDSAFACQALFQLRLMGLIATVVEQLPLELQRNFQLLHEVELQMQSV